MFELIGFIGSLFFAFSTWPQAYQTIKTKDTTGISPAFLFLFLLGSVCFTIYALMTEQYVLLPNFIGGGGGIAVVAFYKVRNALKRGSHVNQ